MSLTQAKFARLLRQAMDALGASNVELAGALGLHETSVSRYRMIDYESGPPPPRRRRAMEAYLGLPPGFLDGDVPADLEALRILRIARQEKMGLAGRSHRDAGETAPGAGVFSHAIADLQREAGAKGMVSLATAVRWVVAIYTAHASSPAPKAQPEEERARELAADRLGAAALTDPPRTRSKRRAG